MNCRHCRAPLRFTMLDLGSAPPSNSYLTAETMQQSEKWFPLRVWVCEECWLAQTQDLPAASELFSDEYAYFSGYSSSWLAHAERYVDHMARRFQLGTNSHVVEVASNDGYLLQFVQSRGIKCTGIEPTASTARSAKAKGLHIVQDFFGARLAAELRLSGLSADLMVANNVLAHVPDINDFVSGFAILLKERGIATFEFPHLLKLIESNQFDTIYHEHFSYLSLTSVQRIFRSHGLSIFEVEEHDTHGGSLRVYAQRADSQVQPLDPSVARILATEAAEGMTSRDLYISLQRRAEAVKNDFLEFLLDAKRRGRRVAAYGAAAKGNTLLNFAGIRSDLIGFIADRNPAKQGKFAPGSRIPIVAESALLQEKPDDIVILPWNLRSEIQSQLRYASDWGARLVTAIPRMEIL